MSPKLCLPLLLTLAACSVGDDYARPITPAPVAWSQAKATAAGWPSADWWKGFGSAELDSYMDGAATANYDIIAAIARVREADAQARVAGSALYPSLDASLGATRAQTPLESKSATGYSSKGVVANQFTGTLTASYEIDFWGKNAAALASAEATAQGSRYDRQTLGLTVQANVATTFFAIIGLQDRITVAQKNLAAAEEVLAAIRDRMAAGTATDLDVAQQEAEVETERAAIPTLEQSLVQNATALAMLVGKLPEETEVAAHPLAGLTIPEVTPGLTSALLARRPDVLSAEQQLVGANADITVARANFFPSIELTKDYGVESAALHTLLKPGSVLWSAGASVAQPIFNGGSLQGSLDYRKARYDELVANYRKAVAQAFTDVENALVATRKSAEEEDAQRRVETAARRAYDIALDQLKGGIVDITTVLNTQKTLFQAEDSLVQARLAHLQAVVGLYKALGGGWDGKA